MRAPMSLSMLLIDGNHLRSALVEAAWRDAGHQVSITPNDADSIRCKISAMRPDVIIDLEASSSARSDDVVSLARASGWSIAARGARHRWSTADVDGDAYLSIFAVDSVGEQDIQRVLDTTRGHLDIHLRMSREVDEARGDLIGRRVIGRAIRILMTVKGLSEREACKRLVGAAVKQNRETLEVADAVVRAMGPFDE